MTESIDNQTESKKERNRNAKGQFTKGHTVGADTRFEQGHTKSDKYKKKYCDEIIDYFTRAINTASQPCRMRRMYYPNGNLKSEEELECVPDFPTFELFAASIGVTDNTLRAWCERYPHFAVAYERAKEIQRGIAITNGVTGKYDGNFTKFILVNNHGMTDKSAVELPTDNGFEVNINVRNS